MQDLGFKVGVQGYLSFDLTLNDDNTLDTWLYWMSECPDYGLLCGPLVAPHLQVASRMHRNFDNQPQYDSSGYSPGNCPCNKFCLRGHSTTVALAIFQR